MPKIKMLQTVKGSDDGIIVTEYMEGEEYLVGDALADVFLAGFDERQIPLAEMAKKEEPATPANKSMKPPKNKRTRGKGVSKKAKAAAKAKADAAAKNGIPTGPLGGFAGFADLTAGDAK